VNKSPLQFCFLWWKAPRLRKGTSHADHDL
jgi:hypothetical protein